MFEFNKWEYFEMVSGFCVNQICLFQTIYLIKEYKNLWWSTWFNLGKHFIKDKPNLHGLWANISLKQNCLNRFFTWKNCQQGEEIQSYNWLCLPGLPPSQWAGNRTAEHEYPMKSNNYLLTQLRHLCPPFQSDFSGRCRKCPVCFQWPSIQESLRG